MNNISGEQLNFLLQLLLNLSLSFITLLYFAIPLEMFQVRSNNAGVKKMTLETCEGPPPSTLCDGHGGLSLSETCFWPSKWESKKLKLTGEGNKESSPILFWQFTTEKSVSMGSTFLIFNISRKITFAFQYIFGWINTIPTLWDAHLAEVWKLCASCDRQRLTTFYMTATWTTCWKQD